MDKKGLDLPLDKKEKMEKEVYSSKDEDDSDTDSEGTFVFEKIEGDRTQKARNDEIDEKIPSSQRPRAESPVNSDEEIPSSQRPRAKSPVNSDEEIPSGQRPRAESPHKGTKRTHKTKINR
ncbi:uncharacterized protein LOC114543286 [Dendronephthya gigantea]|uniref:uncharacterized protein LOC114543286 n=1 Tax=Dendronephthya gigantea TaxID=151771 RepID=UPI00106A2BE4|nr:uncharacterized protein LOC114541926 isoform X2 [Dendronephthya gigantea]XP_028418133.1 uncharacterized protein LOC114543286 [Dendronephthya gigantea]